jgi:hypothetical protein
MTEDGFGTGLRVEIERRHRRGRGGDLVAVPPLSEEVAVADDLPLGQMEENWAMLAAAEERLAEAERELSALRQQGQRQRAQSRRLIERVRRRDRRISELSQPERVEPTPPDEALLVQREADAARGHLLYAQLADRYVLLECAGEPPPPGMRIELRELAELAGVVLQVERIGRSPFPDDSRPCAYVQQVLSS